jgi:hypothetical protein
VPAAALRVQTRLQLLWLLSQHPHPLPLTKM